MNPQNPEYLNNLSNALRNNGQLAEAIAACRQALLLKPNYAEAHSNLGMALKDKGDIDQAIAAYRHAIALRSDFADAHLNLGNALASKGRLDEAADSYRLAVALQPRMAVALCNLGHVLKEQNHLKEAGDACRKAIALDLNFPEAHTNLAHTLLLQGDFLEGWEQFEWRWRCKDSSSPVTNFSRPQWKGSTQTDCTIFLQAEQAFGDTIQFIRYVALVAERFRRVVALCQPELQRLLQSTPGVAQWISPGEPLPPFDFHCPLLSLPLAFGTDLKSIPNAVPYINADPQMIEAWRNSIAGTGPCLKVGLAWAGGAIPEDRSIKLSQLAPLAGVKGVKFFSLQKGPVASQATAGDAGIEVIDFSDKLRDFAETAGLIANLDLVITIDTAVAHLAGAMGKPVWVLLKFVPDWRWMMDRQDSPWYPTMRLFRQKSAGAWDEVIERLAEALQRLGHPSTPGGTGDIC